MVPNHQPARIGSAFTKPSKRAAGSMNKTPRHRLVGFMKCHGFMGSWTSTSSPRNVARARHLSTLPICICNSSASRLAGTESMDFLWNLSCLGWEILCPANQQNLIFVYWTYPKSYHPSVDDFQFSALKREFLFSPQFNFAAKIMRDRAILWYPVSCSPPWLSSRNWTVGFGSSDWVPWVPWVPQKFWMETY